MAAFTYQAHDLNGKPHKGVVEADSARLAREKLRQKNLIPLDVALVLDRTHKKTTVKKGRFSFYRPKISNADLALLTRQLSTLIAAGIALDDALSGVAEQTEKTRVQSIVLGVRARVLEGHALADAMDAFPNAFPRLYRTTISAGEKSGKLDHILEKLADFTERQHAVRQKLTQAMVYPIMMSVVSIAIIAFLLTNVVPKIMGVFTQTHQTLPLSTIVLVGISHGLTRYGVWIVGVLLVMFFAVKRLLKNDSACRRFHQGLLHLPVLGGLIKTVNAARFARTLGILVAAGVPVLEAMTAAVRLIGPIPMQRAVERSITHVREGEPIHHALKKTGFFSPMLVHLVASGEASGRLELMLEKAAYNQERRVEMLLQSALTLFEPIMILVMGGVVLFIVLAVMLPIFALDQLPGF